MADVALSAGPSSLAALLTGAPTDKAGASSTSASPTAAAGDPFAALLASATTPPNVPAAKSSAADMIAALLASAAPAVHAPATAAAASLPVAGTMPVASAAPLAAPAPTPGIAIVAPNAAATPGATALARALAASIAPAPAASAAPAASDAVSADADPAPAKSDDKSDDGSDDAEAMANAIASGATAVLALAPTIVAPVQMPVQAQTPVQAQAPVPTPVKIDGPITPKALKFGQGTTPHGRFLPPSATDPKQAPDQTAPDAQLGADAGQSDAQTPQPQQASVTDAKPAATQLPPAVAKAVVAALQQQDVATPQAPVDPSASAAVAAQNPIEIQAQIQERKAAEAAAQPGVRQVQQQAAPVAPQTAATRRHSDEVAAPRRPGDARKRTDTVAAVDAASAGLTQRTADATRVAPAQGTAHADAKGDAIVQQTLTIGRDGAWLDKLANDIASAGSGGNLQFKLNPQNLGALSVAISQTDDGASIRMTADNERTRDLLVDNQPKLMAEARAQGLKVADTQVDVRSDNDKNQSQSQNQNPNQDASRWAQSNAGQQNASQNGQNRQSSPEHKPFVSNLGRKSEADSESPDRDSDALYA